MRERLAAHATDPTCSSCHLITDPIGLAFENFDALGGYRETDNGAQLDLSGALDGAAFTDGKALAQLIATSPQAATCAVRNLYRYAVGHVEKSNEAAVIDELSASFTATGYRFDELIKTMATSAGLRFAAPPVL
jgi:hypothetical protein